MPSVYCVSCGDKQIFASTKPKFCASCGEPLEPKPAPKRQVKAARYEEPEPELDPTPEYDEEAVRNSIVLHRDPAEGQFMTVEQLRKSSVAFTRGSAPVAVDVKDQVIGEMLGTRPAQSPASVPAESRGGARRVERLGR